VTARVHENAAPTGPIVIAEDEPHMLALLEYVLMKMGYEVLTAGDGEEALARIREHSPALAIVDGAMPGCDGYELSATVRDDAGIARKPHVIMLTAGGRDVDRARAESAGVDEFMTKPFSPSKLRGRVREILGEPA
jgi:two-component system, OmpR family, alkaline phosphatase synthesis response regulator PhoP